jgi:hypothetical protein
MAKTELFVRKQSGGIYTVVNESLTTGNIYFVDSGSSTGGTSAGYGNSPDAPFTTIDSAINQTTANQGDVIYVMTGHSETLTGASAITCDVAGVSIIGLGRGTDRPTLLLDAGASVSIVVSAANVHWENVIFSAGHADITVAIDVSAANASFDKCEWKQNTTNENFLAGIRTSAVANACDGLSVTNSTVTDVDTSCVNFITVREDVDLLVMNDNFIELGVNDSNAVIGVASGKDLTSCQVLRNYVYRLNTAGDLLVDSDTTANSGIMAHNRIGHADTAGEVLIDADGVRQFDNIGTATNTASGYILPAIDS